MNVVDFNERSCDRHRRYFDAYLDNELLVETNQDLLQHLNSCRECAGIIAGRIRIKQLLKAAVDAEEAPRDLVKAVRAQYRTGRRFFGHDAAHLMMAAAAVLLLAIAGAAALSWVRIGPLRRSDGAFQTVSARVENILRVGLVDHIHCALLLQRWKRLVSFEEMKADTGRSALGPGFIALVPAVQAKLGAGYRIVEGHRCIANQRQYIHLILRGNGDTVLSLVITQKGDSFTGADAVSAMQASGIPIYSERQGRLQVAGFESDRYLAYVVSNLDPDSNLKAAAALAPTVYGHLHRLEL